MGDENPSLKTKIAFFIPVILVLNYLGLLIGGSGMFRSDSYKQMIGTLDKREWTQDVQPKDPRHVRLVSLELAHYLATKQLGEAVGAIGSQFQIEKSSLTLQRFKGELWYIAPLDYKGYRAWTSADEAPGYVMVHGEDPRRPVIVKTGEHFKYTPGAFFGDNLERLLWTRYPNKAFTDFSFELDEAGKPWWVVTTYHPTIVFSGEKVDGVTIVDPTTGADKFYAIEQVPDWVDRVVPDAIVHRYITWYGKYQNGWVNSWWGHKDIIEPETPNVVYGADGDPYWVTGITSHNNNDQSLVGLIYTDVRTGKSAFYHAQGGTDAAVVNLVNNQVSYKKLHGSDSFLYNIWGHMTSIVPVLGESHSYQGVALVNVASMQASVGNDLESALLQYQRLLATSSQQIAPENFHDMKILSGKTVDRFTAETKGSETLYYLHIEGIPHIFTGSGEISPKLRLTKPGDKVKMSFIASKEDQVPILAFDNESLPLSQSTNQVEIRERTASRQAEVSNARETKTASAEIKNLSPAELRELIRIKRAQEKK